MHEKIKHKYTLYENVPIFGIIKFDIQPIDLILAVY